jgi:hypothetical protein
MKKIIVLLLLFVSALSGFAQKKKSTEKKPGVILIVHIPLIGYPIDSRDISSSHMTMATTQ